MKHKALSIIRKFSEPELKKFTRYINSPYFNRSTTIVRLYSELIKYYPLFEDTGLTKKNIFFKISPQKSIMIQH